MKPKDLKTLADVLRTIKTTDLDPAPRRPTLAANIAAELVHLDPEFMTGFAAEDGPQDAQKPAPYDLPDPEALLAVLTPSRAYSAAHGPNWEHERQAHQGHRAAHALGAVLAHVALHGSRLLGRHLDEEHRRTLAHALHGAAEHLHPGGNV